MSVFKKCAIVWMAGSIWVAQAQTEHASEIKSITACDPNGRSGSGSCTGGSFDTHQLVIGPDGLSVNKGSLNTIPVPDEHSTVFAPDTLGTNQDYVFFLSTSSNGHASIGVTVLSGGAGPDRSGQWTLDYPKADGYGAYAGGFGAVFNPSSKGDNCPVVTDGNPAHQDQTFDMHYASAGSVVKDPTRAPGSLLMVYEGTNACIGNSGGATFGDNDDYISLAIATSLDYGKTWPTYRATPTFNFVQLSSVNTTQAPNAPMGALGKNVCMGNDCTTTPPASYGRYRVVTPPTSLASLMTAAVPLPNKFGEQEISGFVDDVAGSAKPYIYANAGGVRVARAQLNGGTSPLSFLKWDGKAFASPGIGGVEPSVLPNSSFQNCGMPVQNQYGSSISYVEDTQQDLLTFVCDTPGDPALGQVAGAARGAAWFYSTSYDLSDQTQWTPPREIPGSWSLFDQSGGCADYKGFYPTFMSLGKSTGHLSLTGYVFYLWGCQPGGTPGGRQFSSRAFTITTGPPAPSISLVANAEGESPTIAPNTWVEIKGVGLAPAGFSSPDCAPGYCWQGSDFVGGRMPTQLDKVGATVNGKNAFVYYISPSQINILTPPDAMSGAVQVVVANNSVTSSTFTAQADALAPSFFVFNGGPYLAATHVNGSLIGPTTLFPKLTTPAKPGETIVLYANGFGPTSTPFVSGSILQSGSLSPLPVVKIGSVSASVQFAGLVAPGEFQFNVVVPTTTPDGDQTIVATYDGQSTQAGTLITIQH